MPDGFPANPAKFGPRGIPALRAMATSGWARLTRLSYTTKFADEIKVAFAQYERLIRIANYKLGCIMALIFMPAGTVLDYFVYPRHLDEFIRLRLFCDVFLALVWFALQSGAGRRIYRFLGFMVAFLPLASISWMIYRTNGANSPYYAGLNLVMLGAAILLRWTFFDSILVFLFSLGSYLVACALCDRRSIEGTLVNNLYFLTVTGLFIATGSWFYNRIRFSEFALRHQLDQNKRDLEVTNQKLVEMDRLKSRFFANISHEMRTPLTLLLSPLERLLQRFDKHLDPDVREELAMMQNNGMRLLKLINDLLELIRLEAGRMDVKAEPLAMNEFVRGLASAVRPMAENKQIRLETFVDPALKAVLTDQDKLEKIVLNLLFNALKFTPAKGIVRLRAEKQAASTAPALPASPPGNGTTAPATRTGAEELVIIVSDTGPGIPEHQQPFVFDRFWQADTSSKRKFQGVGIGLALVKELCEMMGGTAAVASREGQGAEFTVRLPFKKAEMPPKRDVAATAPANGADLSDEWLANLYRRAEMFPAMAAIRERSKPPAITGRRPSVLIADDEPDMR
ncbi:MAG: HAMP domain-containing histidine kinase, partial [Verrucomicrobia bacterium]|nr:HAMP domain-containing histidine kinase [Verrucomicrobiota bacterium]